MASDRWSNAQSSPALWLALSLIASVAGCLLLMVGHTAYGIMAIAASCLCAISIYANIRRVRHRVRYLLSAAINGDFSYTFPERGITGHEKEIGQMLNSLTAHLETLDNDARQREEFLRVVINLIDIGIIIANSRGHILHANKASLALLDLPQLTDMRQVPDGISGDLSVAKTQATLHGERLTIYTIADMRRPLQEAEVQSWEKLTRVLTHEIMNSLTPIHSIAISLSAEQSLDADELRQQMLVISSSSHALMEFVRNFRKFSILPKPQPKVFYAKACIDNVVRLMQTQANALNISITAETFPPDALMYTDESMLTQVLINIVKNAIEASPTKISIRTRIRDDETIEISITNNGAHIPADIASQIFTPFFTTKPAGSGIGLSLSRRIINQLSGSLTLTLQPHTAFTIRI